MENDDQFELLLTNTSALPIWGAEVALLCFSVKILSSSLRSLWQTQPRDHERDKNGADSCFYAP